MALIVFANLAAQTAFIDAAFLLRDGEYAPLIGQVEAAEDFTPGQPLLVEITESAEARKVIEAITADHPPTPIRSVQAEDVVVLETPEQFLRWMGAEEAEIQHALDCLSAGDAGFPEERVVVLADGSRLQFPAYPTPCNYVRRTVLFGELTLETAYWDKDEWAEAPAEAMGAIMGSLVPRSSRRAKEKVAS